MAIQCCFERYEKKYCLTLSQQRFLLERMMPYMRKDEYGEYTICNIYYDTDDFRLIRASLEKPIYKEKLRVRSYGVPQADGRVFVELKKKFDGVVYKRRITTDIQNVEPFLSGELPSENFGQIGREIGYFQSFYQTVPKVFIGYDRLAFAGIDDPQLRITFDTNLRWRDTDVNLRLGDHGAPIALPCGDVLMEVKIPGACPLWLCHRPFDRALDRRGAPRLHPRHRGRREDHLHRRAQINGFWAKKRFAELLRSVFLIKGFSPRP